MSQLLLEDFLKPQGKDAPVCREERQYAALLYMAFVAVKNGSSTAPNIANSIVNEVLGDGTQIKEVFFEATLMRDFYYACQRKQYDFNFNQALLSFCAGLHPGINNNDECQERAKEIMCNLKIGDTDISDQNLSNQHFQEKTPGLTHKSFREVYPELLTAAHMMAGKPDLAVVYSCCGKNHLQLLECKYLSRVGTYDGMSQIQVQQNISDFICNSLSYSACENETQTLLETTAVRIVKFAKNERHKNQINAARTRQEDSANKDLPPQSIIMIKDLLKLYEKQQ